MGRENPSARNFVVFANNEYHYIPFGNIFKPKIIGPDGTAKI